MMRSAWTGAIGVAALAAVACSSSSNSSSATSCLANAGDVSSACVSCVESKCGSQLNSTDSACSDYISCACPGGTYSASAAAAASCSAKQMESACTQAGGDLNMCVNSSCNTPCSTGPDGG